MKRVDYRFMRTRGGVTRFAKVTILATPDAGWELAFDVLPAPIRATHESDARRGLQIAIDAHERHGGAPFKLTVESLIASPVDTTTDSVICASALAAWIALGHDEAGLSVRFEAERWRVRDARETSSDSA